MTARPAPERPDWLTVGAEVLIYTTGAIGRRSYPIRTRVAKIATQSFTVDHRNERWQIADRPRYSQRERVYSLSTRHLVPFDSDEARSVLDRERRETLLDAARTACETWQHSRTRENRLAAIEALQAVEDA